MNFNINLKGLWSSSRETSAGIKNFFARLRCFFLGLLVILCFAGFFMLKTAGVDCIKEMRNRKRSSAPVTAEVMSVYQMEKLGKTIGYQTVSYEYNGQRYVSELEYSIEAHASFSTDGDSFSSNNAAKDRRIARDEFKELNETVGTTEELLVDTKNPEKVFYLMDDESYHFMLTLSVISLVPFIILAIVIIVLVKKHKKSKAEMYYN